MKSSGIEKREKVSIFLKISVFLTLVVLVVSFSGFYNESIPSQGNIQLKKVKSPDIILFIADDMTSRDCAPYGNSDVITPNLSKLAEEGLVFRNMYNATAMCGPTRQSLYTGIFPVKNGSYPNHSKVYNNIISIVHHFSAIGYRVALIGKQHYAPAKSFPFDYLGGRNSDNGKGQDIELRNAEKFIQRDRSKPYLLVVATNQPHGPWTRGNPELYNADSLTIAPYMVDTKYTRQQLTQYYAEITYADSLVGDCMNIVEMNGNSNNTIFIFTSEQGSSFPFGKWTCYNMGLKASFIVRWPNVIKPGTETNILSQYIDVVPTLYEAAGGNPADLRGNIEQTMKLDGISFLSAFKGENTEIRKYVYGVQTTRGINNGSENYPVRSIQDHNFKLIWNLNYKETFYCSASRPGAKPYEEWLEQAQNDPEQLKHVKLFRNRPEFELYNLKEDPYELNNLVRDSGMTEIKNTLFKELQKWMAEQGDLGIKTEWKALSRLKGDTLKWRSVSD